MYELNVCVLFRFPSDKQNFLMSMGLIVIVMASLSFWIVIICVLFLFFLAIWLEVYQCYLFKEPALILLIFYVKFLFSISLIYALIFFIIYFLLLALGLYYYSLYSFSRWKLRLLIIDLSYLIYAFKAMKFPLSTAFAAFHNFDNLCFHFLFC